MQAHLLHPPRGAKRTRKRVGRGNASGNGTYAGKGIKGAQARSGPGPHPGFEGGQTPLIRRLPVRRGFRNPTRVAFLAVNLSDLARLPAGSEVTPESLRSAGIVKGKGLPVKLLATGEVSSPWNVRVERVSAAARAKIEAAGGTIAELAPRVIQVRNRKHRRQTDSGAAAGATQVEGSEAQDGSDSETSESGDTN